MLLAIDIGNSNIVLGVFDDGELKGTWRIVTAVHRMPDEYASLILSFFNRAGISAGEITDAVVGSVVPPLVPVFTEVCTNTFDITPLVVEAGVKTGIRINMDNPREVGADRIINAVGAYKLYGGPAIVIDLGTATTFDVISANGTYMGGAIAPGISIATEALFNRTAVLPRVDLVHPKRAIGTSTVEAMNSGIVFGYVGLIEGLIARIKKELGENPVVIATGGYSRLLAAETTVIDKVERNITMIGLRLIYEMNREYGGGKKA